MSSETEMISAAERDLIHAAITVVKRRASRPDGYAGLSAAAATGLCHTLSGIADGAPEMDGVEHGEALCLAHRVLDDDHPEHSVLWPDHTDRP